MNRRIIKENNELKKAIEYFNVFHDGFLKSIKIISGNKFGQNPPWEKSVGYKSNDEELRDTGLWFSEKTGLFLEIHHHNYDWPNKPLNNKIILFLQNVKNIDPNMVKMVGLPIYDCETIDKNSTLSLIFTFVTYANNKPEQIKIEPLEFDKISIQEKN